MVKYKCFWLRTQRRNICFDKCKMLRLFTQSTFMDWKKYCLRQIIFFFSFGQVIKFRYAPLPQFFFQIEMNESFFPVCVLIFFAHFYIYFLQMYSTTNDSNEYKISNSFQIVILYNYFHIAIYIAKKQNIAMSVFPIYS